MTHARWGFSTLAFLVVVSRLGCAGNGNPDVTHGSGGAGFGGNGGGNGGASDGGPGDGAGPDSGDGNSSDAALAAVQVGIVPTVAVSDGGSSVDQTLANLEVLAAGSRGVSFVRRWNQLYSTPVDPIASEWAALEKNADLYRDADRKLLVCLTIVDRTLDVRPSGLAGGFNELPTRQALDTLIDRTFAAFDGELLALSFGNEIDRWLLQASASERSDMLALIQHGVDYARAHPSKPGSTWVGVTLGVDALISGKPSEITSLAAMGDAVIVDYWPVDASFEARAPTTAAEDLEKLAALDGGEGGADLPILFQTVAYPSSSESASSLDQQKIFFENLFGALATRRERFPFVSVLGLHDGDPQSCVQEAALFGAPANAKVEASRCSLGLKTNDGKPKPAFSTVLDALATFAPH